MTKQYKEKMSQKLFFLMLIITASFLSISIPLILNSYQDYVKTENALSELRLLQSLAHTSNLISRERGYANMVMSSPVDELHYHQQALINYRSRVDQQLKLSVDLLNTSGMPELAEKIKHVSMHLNAARINIDRYSATPMQARDMESLYHNIEDMFEAWDDFNLILKGYVNQSKSIDQRVSYYFMHVLLLADLRDQAGRTASCIIAPIAFSQPISSDQRKCSTQAQQQTIYLWHLLSVLQLQSNQTERYIELKQKFENLYLDQALKMINGLIAQGESGKSYSLSGMQLTQAIVDKFAPVVDLQNYIIQYNMNLAIDHKHEKQSAFIFALIVSSLAVLVAIFTLIYAKRRMFDPLLQVRELIFALSESNSTANQLPLKLPKQEFFSLFEAIHKLQVMLQQRDEMAYELQHIAHSDTLTGVSNRLALDKYIKLLESHPEHLNHVCLMMIDIDDFKRVNDTYGHLVGDQVICHVAQQLKNNVRKTDHVIRYGGDEFLILMESVDHADAIDGAEKIRQQITTSTLQMPQYTIKISVTIGIAYGATSWTELMKKADSALLKAKKEGKNRIMV